MKNLFPTLFVILLLITAAFTQDKVAPKEQSKLEQFSARSGSLLEKRFVPVGTIKSVKVEVLVLTDLLTNSKISGVRFSYDTGERYSTEKTAFLDADEIDGLIKSIDYIKTKALPATPESYTEIVYSSRSGFTAGCYYSDSKWTAFMKLERFDTKSFVSLDIVALDQLAGLLKDAKTKLT